MFTMANTMKAIDNDSGPRLIDRSGAEARERADITLNIARVNGAVRRLKKTGRAAIVATGESPIKGFKQGIDGVFDNDRRDNPRTLWVSAEGNIQDKDFDHVQKTLQGISKLRRSLGFVVLAFEAVDFSASTESGSPRITQRISDILTKQDNGQQEDDVRKGMFGDLYKGKYRRDFGVLVIGTGKPEDLPSHPSYNQEAQSDFLSLFPERLALLGSGELAEGFPYPGLLTHLEEEPQ
jgi:hypothetical protein